MKWTTQSYELSGTGLSCHFTFVQNDRNKLASGHSRFLCCWWTTHKRNSNTPWNFPPSEILWKQLLQILTTK